VSYLDSSYQERFVITGIKYAPPGNIVKFKLEALKLLQQGKYPNLTLKHDLKNEHDKFAIHVCWEDCVLGFLPARGTTCTDCWSKVSRKTIQCPVCASPDLVPYGLNYRFFSTGGLNNYICLLTDVIDGKVNPYHCELYWSPNK